jgi:hypothetical protein
MLRAAQLDLARQMETPTFIREFADVIRQFGYNALVLYLEGRIRTRSFPYMPKERSYSLGQMAELVEYASRKGITVIPVVPTLAHADQFLQFPEMAKMAELRNGAQGRFGNNVHQVCPSLEETYRFFESYFAELAEIFPSPYFHVGGDEAWDLGFCSLCRRRLRKGESPAEIFARHVRDMHAIIVRKLRKRMLMWDDMFELYPEALTMIPRDIILCCWQYDSLVEMPRTHFGKRVRQDRLALYDQLGFDYLFCPADYHPRNAQTFYRYASDHQPMGALLTTWEKGDKFLLEDFPIVAFAGALWTKRDLENPDRTFMDVCRRIFGLKDPVFLQGLLAAKNLERWPEAIDVQDFLRGPVTPYEFEREKAASFLHDRLAPFAARIPSEKGRRAFADILLALRREQVQHELRSLLPEICSARCRPDSGNLSLLLARGERVLRKIEEISRIRAAQWRQVRPGLKPVGTDNFYRVFRKSVACFLKRARQRKGTWVLLHVRYFLPDAYGAQSVRLSIQYRSSAGWRLVYFGVPKPNLADPSQTPYYMFSHLISGAAVPTGLRIESSGYGGIGLAFVEVVTQKGSYVPRKIRRIQGRVENPELLLTDDTRWCLLGEQDANKAFFAPQVAARKHVLEIALGRK